MSKRIGESDHEKTVESEAAIAGETLIGGTSAAAGGLVGSIVEESDGDLPPWLRRLILFAFVALISVFGLAFWHAAKPLF